MTGTSPRQSRWTVAALLALILVIIRSPFTLLVIAFWAAAGPWEFTGQGLRHWVFVRGSTADRLGFVAATGRPSSYLVRLADGTDPGEISVTYYSEALPDDVVSVYAVRCRAMGLAVKKRVLLADASEARLVCEGDQALYWSDDVFVIANHLTAASTTQVRIFAGPGLTATYGF